MFFWVIPLRTCPSSSTGYAQSPRHRCENIEYDVIVHDLSQCRGAEEGFQGRTFSSQPLTPPFVEGLGERRAGDGVRDFGRASFGWRYGEDVLSSGRSKSYSASRSSSIMTSGFTTTSIISYVARLLETAFHAMGEMCTVRFPRGVFERTVRESCCTGMWRKSSGNTVFAYSTACCRISGLCPVITTKYRLAHLICIGRCHINHPLPKAVGNNARISYAWCSGARSLSVTSIETAHCSAGE